MRGRLVAAAAVAAVLATAGCTSESQAEGGSASEPSADSVPSPSPTEPTLTLGDVSVSGTAQSNRSGMLLCGDRLVAAPPTAGIENNAFAVFDETSGEGEITHVELPAGSDLEENARWLLVMECIDNPDVTPDGPVLSFAYQEMPLPETGGVGVRGAYTLDGQLLWMRGDINQPAQLVDGLLVLGAAPDQPDLVVDAVTGKTVREFTSPLSTRIVLNHERMVVRGAGGGPVLTDIEGQRVASLRTSGSFSADGGLVFGANFRNAVALRARNGQQRWSYPIRLDPLGEPRVDESSNVVVFMDHNYVAHAVDLRTGEQLWRHPTGVENPRVTAAGGVVLIDRRDEGYQALFDARSGLQLPDPPETVVDLKAAGALLFRDGVATIVAPDDLRRPPATSTEMDEIDE